MLSHQPALTNFIFVSIRYGVSKRICDYRISKVELEDMVGEVVTKNTSPSTTISMINKIEL